MTRTWTPCRECGTEHQNPRSSSLCPTCGEAQGAANEAARLQAEQERVDPVTAAMNAAYGFDMEQQEALRDMLQAFYDTMQETG